MESLSNIVEYIDNMRIKTTAFGGFDKEAVYAAIQDISSMYQKHITDLQRENMKLKADAEAAGASAGVSNADQRQLDLFRLSAEAAKREAENAKAALEEAKSEKEKAEAECGKLLAELETAKSDAAGGEALSAELEAAVKHGNELEKSLSEAFERIREFDGEIREAEKKIISSNEEIIALKEELAKAYEKKRTECGMNTEASEFSARRSDECAERMKLLDNAVRALKSCEERAYSEARARAESIVNDAYAKADRIIKESEARLYRKQRELDELNEAKMKLDSYVNGISDQLHEIMGRIDGTRHPERDAGRAPYRSRRSGDIKEDESRYFDEHLTSDRPLFTSEFDGLI